MTDEMKKNTEKSRDLALDRLHEAGKLAGLSEKATLARVDLAMKSVMDDTDKNCVNISVILNKYGEFCKALLENPSRKLEELTNQGAPNLR